MALITETVFDVLARPFSEEDVEQVLSPETVLFHAVFWRNALPSRGLYRPPCLTLDTSVVLCVCT